MNERTKMQSVEEIDIYPYDLLEDKKPSCETFTQNEVDVYPSDLLWNDECYEDPQELLWNDEEAFEYELEEILITAENSLLTTENEVFIEPIHKKLIEKYKKILNIPTSEAFEYIRRCHFCGSADKDFSEAYCSEGCQDRHYDFNYPCYWNHEKWADECVSNCKMCSWNDYLKNPSYLNDDV